MNAINSLSNQSVSPKGSLFTLRNAISEHLIKLGYPETSLRSLNRCGVKTGMKMIRHCKDCGDNFLIDLEHRCNLRTCHVCSEIRKKRILNKYLPYFSQFKTTRGSPKSLYFLSIAPENYKSPKEGQEHIKKSWKKFLRTKYIKERVEGGLWVIESKDKNPKEECKGWHTHIHALFYGRRLDNCIRGKCSDCGQNYIKFNKFDDKYYCANRKCRSTKVHINQDSKLVRFFQSCSNRKVHIDIKEMIWGAKGALNYVLKYVSANKDSFSSPKAIAEYIFSTRKQKLLNLFGTFSKIRPKKQIIHCWRCGGEVEFIFDPQLNLTGVTQIYGPSTPPPEPKTLILSTGRYKE